MVNVSIKTAENGYFVSVVTGHYGAADSSYLDYAFSTKEAVMDFLSELDI